MAAVNAQTYGRGQIEWALWRAFTLGHMSAPKDAPKPFLTRIKRLLEIDRDLADSEGAASPPASAYAFAPPPSAGEAAYTPVDVFCLAIALDLLDAGFKQAEIVFLMRHMRVGLADQYATLVARPSLIDRQRRAAHRFPNLPSFEQNGKLWVDSRVFLLIGKVETTEIAPEIAKHGRAVFLEPQFCEGLAGLNEYLNELMPLHRRIVTVLEIAAAAQAVAATLPQAPAIRRGRPPAN